MGDEFKFSLKEVKEIVHGVDFITYLFGIISEHIKGIRRNLSELPKILPSQSILSTLGHLFDSITTLDQIGFFIPSDQRCKREFETFFDYHSALIVYYDEFRTLIRHSLISAFTGHYSVAYVELRTALESIIRGITFDLLAIPDYRNKAKILLKIRGFKKGSPSFKELINLLDEAKGSERFSSVSIFDMIDRKLKEFNPVASFTNLLKQVKEWGVIDSEVFRDVEEYYKKLSQYAHRVHPNSTEIGLRILAGRDWIDELEPIPEMLAMYVRDVISLIGICLYLVLRVFILDYKKEFTRCLDEKGLAKVLSKVEKLGKYYKPWKKVLEASKELVASLSLAR